MAIQRGPNKGKDLSGKTYGQLTFVRATTERRGGTPSKSGKIVWEVLCSCGTTTFNIASNILAGETQSCGCVRIAHGSRFGERMMKVHRKHEPMVSSARAKWASNYKDCEFELFYALSQRPCHYCGRPPHREAKLCVRKKGMSQNQIRNGGFVYNGLDRIDNSKGHTPENVVPCCWDCNHMKGKRSITEFLSHIERISFFTLRRKVAS